MKIRFAVAPALADGDGTLAELLDGLEGRGFDGVWLSDVPVSGLVDPIVGLSAAATRTARLKLGANVVPLGRNPFLLAKALAQIDRASSGRLLLSFVPGLGSPVERETLGVTGADRGRILEEVLGLVRTWWQGRKVTTASSRWTFADLALPVRPVQDPLEVWLGGRGPKALDRVGRVGDGWLGSATTPAESAEARRRIEEAAAAAGRTVDPEHFGLSLAYARVEPDAAALVGVGARRPDVDPRELLPVGRDGLRRRIADYVAAGISKFVLRPLGPSDGLDADLDWLAGAVLDLQT